jgi:hypothetical protein
MVFAFGRGVVEVDPAEAPMAEEGFVEAVGGVGAQGDRLPAQALAEEVSAVAPGDSAFGFDRADLVTGRVFDGWQVARQRPRAGRVAAGGCGQRERLVRALVIVDRPPAIGDLLAMAEVAQVGADEHFGRQGAMEALLFALGLLARPPASLFPSASSPVRQPDLSSIKRFGL